MQIEKTHKKRKLLGEVKGALMWNLCIDVVTQRQVILS